MTAAAATLGLAARLDAGAARDDADPRLSAPSSRPARPNGDAHVIEFVETLLAEHRLRPEPVYLAAAEDVLRL